jgi:hypothetical protein
VDDVPTPDRWLPPIWGVGEAARVLGLKKQGISKACRVGGGVVVKRGRPDYKFFFEFAEPTEPDLLEGDEWKPWDAAYLGYLGYLG